MADVLIPQNDELPEVPSLDDLLTRVMAYKDIALEEQFGEDPLGSVARRRVDAWHDVRSALSGLLARLRELSADNAGLRLLANDNLQNGAAAIACRGQIKAQAERDALSVRLRQAELDRDRYGAAILWAMGADPEALFAARPDGAGPYWWRTELRTRAFGEVGEALAPPAAPEKPDDVGSPQGEQVTP